MSKKTYTLLVSSNRKGKTLSYTVPSGWLKGLLVVGCVLAVVLSASVLDYIGLLLQSAENKRLKAEGEQLRQQFKLIETKVDTLEKSLERVKTFSKKLRLITNIEDDDRALSLSVNSEQQTESGLMNSGEKRDPANLGSIASNTDSLFLNRPLLDSEGGELAKVKNKNYGTLSIRIDRAVKNTQLTEQGVMELYDALAERQSLINATPNIRPTRGWATSYFGYRLDPFTGKPQMHNGLDIAAAPGTPVYAPADGVVSYVGYEHGYGKLVSIDHGFGVVTRYAHNSQVFVEVGQKIAKKDIISEVGSTGRSSGPHLHYEVRVHGMPVDPKNYILDTL